MTSKHKVLMAGPCATVIDDLRALRPDWVILDRLDGPLLGHAALDRAGNHRTGEYERAKFDGEDRDEPVFGFVPWLLPRMAGIEACRRLRVLAGSGVQTQFGARRLHLTMVLDAGAPGQRMRAIDAGADDYMFAPLTASAIVARIGEAPPVAAAPASQQLSTIQDARGDGMIDPPSGTRKPIERGAHTSMGLLRQGDLLADPQAFRVRHNSRIVPLSRGEFAMLVYFMQRPNRVISRAALAEQTGKAGAIRARTIDRSVARLRKTFETHAVPAPIRTVYGIGYVFDAVD